MATIHVSSEIDPLRKVIVHRPDAGVSRVTPKRSDELLYDDIVFLPAMQSEHDVFTDLLRAFCGEENVVDYNTLLLEALREDEGRRGRLIDEVVDYAELPQKTKTLLASLQPAELAELLITGYHAPLDRILFDPIPNFVFTRDLAIVVNDFVVLAKAATEARSRENFIVRFVFDAHPDFRQLNEQGRLIDLNDVDAFPPGHRGQLVRVEGGDVMVLDGSYLLIGISERTNAYSADLLAKALFERGVIEHVVKVEIPADRAYMHLDTIFTQFGERDFACYGPIIQGGLSSHVQVLSAKGTQRSYASVREFVQAELDAKANFIACGRGESPYQEREQWTDACNLVALQPGVAVTYDRNVVTADAFRDAGYDVVPAHQVIEDIKSGKTNPSELRQTIITLPSSELSRARGGGHCMTCPLARSPQKKNS